MAALLSMALFVAAAVLTWRLPSPKAVPIVDTIRRRAKPSTNPAA